MKQLGGSKDIRHNHPETLQVVYFLGLMRLTNYGKKVVMVTGAILCALVFVLGSIVCLGDLAYIIRINQQAYNVLFIVGVMPVCCISGVDIISKLRRK